MNILLTNDDGVDSNITLSLLKALEEDGHNVTLIAPSKDKSGQGAAITLRSDVKIEKLSNNIYSVDGTPADCVFMGLMAIFCLLYTSPSPRDRQKSRMPSSA